MSARKLPRAVGVLAGTLSVVTLAFSATPQRLSGGIVGMVSNSAGVPQMGASVLLSSQFDRLLQRVLTSESGAFSFDSLPPDVYTVRVSLASFLPALKRNIVVQPGMQSLLNVSLASVFSSVELVGVAPGQKSLMSEEWRWVLRSASATRPVLRLLPRLGDPAPQSRRTASMFSDTRGVVRVSGGDLAGGASGSDPDLGTAFALATSFLGRNQLQVSGNLGYSSYAGVPTAAIRTSFRRDLPGGLSGPELKLTMRQVFLPARVGAALFGGMATSAPMLRTLSATMLDSQRLTDRVRIDYGASIDSLTFLERLNYISPYARLTYDRGSGEAIEVGYASGTPPAEAFSSETGRDLEFQQDLAALAMFPRVSLRSGMPRVQRTRSVEVGYHRKAGSRTYRLAAYRDNVTNAAVTMVGPGGVRPGADLLPDLLTNSWTFNAGRYHNIGYLASVTQDLGDHAGATLAYGSGAALRVEQGTAETSTPDELRESVRIGRRHSLTARVSSTVPRTGTRLVASYQWSNLRALNAPHMYLTQRAREELGLNVSVRQPVPYFGGLPGRVEASAELRNLLAEGYSPLNFGGRRAYLLQTPRSVRGSLSFIF
jgi:hypothetical protein